MSTLVLRRAEVDGRAVLPQRPRVGSAGLIVPQ
jgi:hypothetical protein